MRDGELTMYIREPGSRSVYMGRLNLSLKLGLASFFPWSSDPKANLPHLTVKASALQCHVDDRRDKWEAIADRSWFLRILRETEEGHQQYIGCGSNAGGDLETGRHANCVGASFPT